MGLLGITQERITEKRYRVRVELEEEGQARQTVDADFEFELTPDDQERIRWYLEDYLQYPQEPAPTIAAGVEKRIAEIGTTLFKALFQSSDDARDLWATLRGQLNETRVEVVTSVEEATAIPWELVRDPKTDVALALRAEGFVRGQPQAAQRPKLPEVAEEGEGPVRILLVICRPGGREDVPFRSVASRLIKGLSEDQRSLFQLDVLRPATFGDLGKRLREAKADGRPYHVVHFDGHGMYAETPEPSKAAEWLKKLGMVMLSGPRAGSHGYLLFENAEAKENIELVDGPALGRLLVETDVGVLVLNACRSAHADVGTEPKVAASEQEDPHGKVRALGSLAQEVMDAGVGGVVAMRYNVYVVTAAQFVADLYGALSRGRTVGEAVTLGRKQLAAEPLREIAFEPRALQDWCVPVVYEAAPIRLFPEAEDTRELEIKLRGIGESGVVSEEAGLDAGLPKTPDAGFYGRDETLLALDRAFDTQSVVLLHAYAGSGKTATAAEFARWYTMTGGLGGGPVLFTTFERHTPLRSVLGHFGQIFGPLLERAGVNWSAIIETGEMRDIALQVLRQVPGLWIWDNVEPVAGFPAGTQSAWSEEEQWELVDFLRDGRETRARFLLTSRRDEREWLGDELPMRITVPPMPMAERVQLARGLAERYGRRLEDVEDWRPLLKFTKGNPLTVTVLVGQALREGLKSKSDVEGFVEKLQKGEATFADEQSQGRSKSLGASLSYGFEQAFGENERKKLALLHLFQGFVDVDGLKLMGDREVDWGLAELRGLTREAGIRLLDKAAEVGLLTAHGGGYYSIHPALPWFFKGLFDKYYAAQAEAASRAFVEAMGELGDYYIRQYEGGKREVIGALRAEEANLLYARQLAVEHGWWDAVMGTMQGLHELYDHTGRRAEWKRLVEETLPDFVDPATDGPLPGREDHWSIVTYYRVRLAEGELQWLEAERLQRIRVEWDRERAVAALEKRTEALDRVERNLIRTLGTSLHGLGQIQRGRGEAVCVESYKEALELAEGICEQAGTAICAFNLGHAYVGIGDIRDLDKAEEWYRRSLELRDEGDRLGKAHCLAELGSVAYERFDEARDAGRSKEEVLRHLNEALRQYQRALEMLPADAVDGLAVVQMQLGNIYGDAGDVNRALEHYREAIRYREMQGNLYGAGQTRYNVALDLYDAGRFTDALEYARAALRNFESYGEGAAADIAKTKKRIGQIEKGLKEKER
ncbi:MAG: tetratricopeptide repeat protein [Planctomycetota bacterium]|jgi:tetratricopeptide (TPR) repeat protein